MKITPILFMQRIEASLEFWTQRLGFEKTVEVPQDDHLGFVILIKDGGEVMLQTQESMDKDLGPEAQKFRGATTLFMEVADFADIRQRVAGAEIVVPERVTFYGMREIGVREPGGHLLIFASKEEAK